MSEREAILNQIRIKAPQEWAQYGPALEESLRLFPRYASKKAYRASVRS